MTAPVRVTVLMTVHNRSATTEACLARLDAAAAAANVVLRRVIVDDGSTDDTPVVLDRLRRPEDRILAGPGDLFWAGGMRRAMACVDRLEQVDHVLLLNDDAELFENGLVTLLATAEQRSDTIVVGRFVDPVTQAPTYGGYRRKSRLRPLSFLPENEVTSRCVTAMNANAVLVGSAAFASLGGFERRFTHALADFDYALRAARSGIELRLSREVVGTCPRNPVAGSWNDRALRRPARLQKMLSPKGLPPREWALFCWRHAGLMGIPYIVTPWLRLLLPVRPRRGDTR